MAIPRPLKFHIRCYGGKPLDGFPCEHGNGSIKHREDDRALAANGGQNAACRLSYLGFEIYRMNREGFWGQGHELRWMLRIIPFAAVLQDAIQPGLVKQTVSLRGGGHNQHGQGGDRNPHAHNIATGAA